MASLNSLKERICRIERMEPKLPLDAGGDIDGIQMATATEIQDLLVTLEDNVAHLSGSTETLETQMVQNVYKFWQSTLLEEGEAVSVDQYRTQILDTVMKNVSTWENRDAMADSLAKILHNADSSASEESVLSAFMLERGSALQNIATSTADSERLQEEVRVAQERLAKVESDLERATNGAATLWIETSGDLLTLHYEGMPEGIRAILMVDGGDPNGSLSLAAGTHSVGFGIPTNWGRRIIEVGLQIQEISTGVILNTTPTCTCRLGQVIGGADGRPMEITTSRGGEDTDILEVQCNAIQQELSALEAKLATTQQILATNREREQQISARLAAADTAFRDLNSVSEALRETSQDLEEAQEELNAQQAWQNLNAMADALAEALVSADPSAPTKESIAALQKKQGTVLQTITETEADIARLAEEMCTTQKNLAQIEGELERATAGAATMRIETGGNLLTLHYERMPEGIRAILMVDGGDPNESISLAAGTHSVGFGIPTHWGRRIIEVGLQIREISTGAILHTTSTYACQLGRVIGGADSGTIELGGTASSGKDASVLEAERDMVTQRLSTLEAEILTAQETLAANREQDRVLTEQLALYEGVPTVEEKAQEHIESVYRASEAIRTWKTVTLAETVALTDGVDQLAQEYANLSALTAQFTTSVNTLQPLLAGEHANAALQNNVQIVMATLETHVRNWQERSDQYVQIVQSAMEEAMRPRTDTLSFADPLSTTDGRDPSMDFALAELGGSASIKSWLGDRANPGNLSSNEEGNILSAEGSVVSLDLHQANSIISTFETTLQMQNGGGATIGFFRGSTLISQQEAASGDTVTFENADGITGVIIRPHDTSDTVMLTGTAVTGMTGDTQAEAEELSSGSNKWIGLYAAPAWASGEEFNYIETGLAHDADYSWSTTKPVSGLPMMPNAMGSATEYRNFTVTGHNGSVHIDGVFYINEEGLHALPSDYYTQENAQSVTVHAGGPKFLAFRVLGRGDYHFNISQGGTREAVAPPEGMVLQPNILAFFTQHCGQEGFRDPILEINQQHRPILSGAMHLVANIQNIGSGGGEVTVGVYYGYTGTTQDRLVSTFTTSFDSNQMKGFYANFDNPQGGEGDYPVVTICAVMPDGTEVTTSSGGGRYHSMDQRVALPKDKTTDEDGNYTGGFTYVSVPRSLEGLERELRIATIAMKSAEERGDTSRDYEGYVASCNAAVHASLAALLQQSIVVQADTPEEIAQLQQEIATAGMTLEEQLLAAGLSAGTLTEGEYYAELERMFSGVEIGGIQVENMNIMDTIRSAVAARGESALFAETQGWYDPNVSTEALNAINVRHDSFVGKIFKGLLQQLQQADGNGQEQCRLAAVVEAVTAIPAEKILAAMNIHDPLRMHDLFFSAGYGSIFLTEPMTANATAQVLATNVAIVDGSVRIRFDVVPDGRELTSVKVYNATTGEEYSGTRHTTFILIPLDRLAMSAENLQFDVRASFADGSTVEKVTEGMNLSGYVGVVSPEHFSDNPVENEILNKIAQHLPVDTSNSWFNYLESPDHKGVTLNAVDLNYGTVGEDRDATIYAVDSGVVHKIYKSGDVTILVLRHSLSSGQTWDSVCMHMPMVEHVDNPGIWDLTDSSGGVIAVLKQGDRVNAGQAIAANGKEGTSGEHVHFEAHTGDWRSSSAINLDSMLRSNGIVSKINAGNKSLYEVSFNADLRQWVNEVDRVIAYVPSGNSLADAYTVAWEEGKSVEEMERVIWKKVVEEEYPDGIFRWRSAEDDSKIWDGEKWIFSASV